MKRLQCQIRALQALKTVPKKCWAKKLSSDLKYGKLSNVKVRLQIHLRFGFALLHVRQKVLVCNSFWNSRKWVFFSCSQHIFFTTSEYRCASKKLNSAYKSRDESLSDHIWSSCHREAKKATHGLRTQSVVGPCGCAAMLMLHQFCRDILQISEQKCRVDLCSCWRHVGVNVLKVVYTVCIFIHLIIFYFSVKGSPQNMTICHTWWSKSQTYFRTEEHFHFHLKDKSRGERGGGGGGWR